MKRISLVITACSMAMAAHAQIIDDFSGNLSAYTLTKVLDQGTVNNVSFAINGGALTGVSAGADGAEQVLFLRNDFSLGIGQMLMADVNFTLTGSQDFGIVVAATAAQTIGVRQDYIFSGVRSTADHPIANGFNGTTGFSLAQDQGTGIPTASVFIARTSATSFDLGYNRGAGNVVLTSFTVGNANIGNAVGFYADMRANGTIGTFDNLRIQAIPEPGSLSLLAFGGIAALIARRQKKAA
jgi:hypothetical protein